MSIRELIYEYSGLQDQYIDIATRARQHYRSASVAERQLKRLYNDAETGDVGVGQFIADAYDLNDAVKLNKYKWKQLNQEREIVDRRFADIERIAYTHSGFWKHPLYRELDIRRKDRDVSSAAARALFPMRRVGKYA